MSSPLDKFFEVTREDDFEEIPVPLEEFLYSDEFLNLPPLSHYQIQLLEAMTQIYKYDTLVELWGYEEADRQQKATAFEIIFQLGKGSGKDFVTSVAFARIIYLLLCLKDPASYYGKPPGDSIHLLNVAINATQAKNVFFAYLKQRINGCRWFAGRHNTKADSIEFDKNISAHSGHSDREAWEGYNLLVVVLDEIAGFSTEAETTGSREGKTADAIYDMYSASVSSRFPKYGKLALLSFPRYKGDFIQSHYDKAIADKEVEIKSHTFKIHEDLPDGLEGNEFTIEYEIDHIVAYRRSNVFALRRPTWYVNPGIEIDDYKDAFYRDVEDSLGRFACMPPDAVDAMFKDKKAIERAFPDHIPGPFDANWGWRDNFVPEKGKPYYMHVDLGYTHDRAAVAMAHAVDWVWMDYGGSERVASPIVKLDAVRWWTPTTDKSVNFQEIEDYIVGLKRRGFDIRLVTFDRWSSVQFRQRLEANYAIQTEMLSVAKPHYEDFGVTMAESRLRGYNIELARDEFAQLQIIKGNKVDHPRKGSKDVADAIAGAVYNVVVNTEPDHLNIVEVRYLGGDPYDDEDDDRLPEKEEKQEMPDELAEFLQRMTVL